ncbi:MAG: hypothetical protein LKK19_00990 [Bacteroidales bacterium]|jgi:hypothetical protein|nr:hypothetical protein [Bacteroidales bacterium]MCI2121262.1 hypothetical protein [Bacteroidales bacterium]MCI2146142.1 hypothetical protein [Bacteroidales bacterium]
MKKSLLALPVAIVFFAVLLSGCDDNPYYSRVYNVYYMADTTGTDVPVSAKTYRAIKNSVDSMIRTMQSYVAGAWYETALKSEYSESEAEAQMDSDAVEKFGQYSKVYQTDIGNINSAFQKKLEDSAAALADESATISYTARYYLVKINDADSAVTVSVTDPYVISNE